MADVLGADELAAIRNGAQSGEFSMTKGWEAWESVADLLATVDYYKKVADDRKADADRYEAALAEIASSPLFCYENGCGDTAKEALGWT